MKITYAGLNEKDKFIVQGETSCGPARISCHRVKDKRWMVRYRDVLYLEDETNTFELGSIDIEMTKEEQVLEDSLNTINEYLQRLVDKDEVAYIEYKDQELENRDITRIEIIEPHNKTSWYSKEIGKQYDVLEVAKNHPIIETNAVKVKKGNGKISFWVGSKDYKIINHN